MMMSTPFAFDNSGKLNEDNVFLMVDGDHIRVAYLKDLQRELLSL